MIAGVLCAKTPQYGGAVAIKVNRPISLSIMAITTRAYSLATTIVIGHEVAASINWVATRTNPGNGRGFSSWRTRRIRASTAGA